MPPEIRSRFTDLLLVLHVDKRPLEPLKIPTLTRLWDVFSDGENDMPVKDQVPKFLGILKDFVRDFLMKKKGCQKLYQGYENGLTLSMLKLAKSLIIFGFYRTEDELIKMIDPLITQLDGSHDAATEDEENDMKKYGISEEQYPIALALTLKVHYQDTVDLRLVMK